MANCADKKIRFRMKTSSRFTEISLAWLAGILFKIACLHMPDFMEFFSYFGLVHSISMRRYYLK